MERIVLLHQRKNKTKEGAKVQPPQGDEAGLFAMILQWAWAGVLALGGLVFKGVKEDLVRSIHFLYEDAFVRAILPVDGEEGRAIRLHPLFLESATTVDSVIVNASARYHGTLVSGSPVRLVVRVKPR